MENTLLLTDDVDIPHNFTTVGGPRINRWSQDLLGWEVDQRVPLIGLLDSAEATVLGGAFEVTEFDLYVLTRTVLQFRYVMGRFWPALSETRVERWSNQNQDWYYHSTSLINYSIYHKDLHVEIIVVILGEVCNGLLEVDVRGLNSLLRVATILRSFKCIQRTQTVSHISPLGIDTRLWTSSSIADWWFLGVTLATKAKVSSRLVFLSISHKDFDRENSTFGRLGLSWHSRGHESPRQIDCWNSMYWSSTSTRTWASVV